MSEIRGIAQTLKLLDTLRATIHEFAAREEKLNAEFRSRSALEKKSFEAAVAAQAEQSAEAHAKTEAEFANRRERCRARYEQRKSKISRGHMASRARALERIKEQEGRRKYKVQEGTINAERLREKSLAEAAAAYQQFSQDLAETQQEIMALELKAHRAFNGYGALRKKISSNSVLAEPDRSADELQLLAQLRELATKVRGELDRFGHLWLAQIFRFFPIWLSIILLLLASVCLVPALHRFGGIDFPWQQTGIGLAAAAVVFIVGRLAGAGQAKPAAAAIANDLVRARQLEAACQDRGRLHYQNEQERIKNEHVDSTRALNQDWKRAVRESIDMLDLRPRKIDEQAMRLTQKNEQLYRAMLRQLENEQPVTMATLQKENDSRSAQLIEAHTTKTAALQAEFENRWRELEAEWKRRIGPIHESIAAANAAAARLFPDWNSHDFQNWNPPQQFANAAKFGRLDVEIKEFVESIPKDQRLAYPDSGNLSLPLLLTYPTEGSILLETSNGGGRDAVAAINSIIYRLLATTPPGKLSFTIFDPVGLGQNFAGIMHLADYEESNINSRIWTQTTQLEEKLAELNEHMEKVIQMYLRNEYATIAEYNAQAGTIAEKYHFLVVADFPVNFSDTAARRLINIATSGARCGVYTLIHWDRRHAIPQGFVADELRKSSVCLVRMETGFRLEPRHPEGGRAELDPPPSPELATDFLRRVGEQSKDSNRVEVPFEQVAPPPAEIWTEETTEELTVPIGRSGATKLQYLAIGKGTRQHALIAGKTGSGKSTLFHVIVTNLALWCSPEQVEFYLVDFKKGVEFKCYATRRLPHARVVAIESDRQFGLSVLERVDAELRRRGDLFRQLGVQDLSGYKRAGGQEAMPRSLLIIDEFQEFFTEEDRVSQGAAVLLDRIVRQGRAFGIHVLLGSQTLGGAYTLARATIGQMVIRIALQCNEADAYLIMDQDNPAPRLLSRPGEGIYNDAAGAIEGNSPFQAVWLPEEVRDDYLSKVREQADQSTGKYPGPFVFEGNAPADVQDNAMLEELLKEGRGGARRSYPTIWLGAPNSVKGPTEAVFQRQSGNNLLVVGQSEEPSLTIVAVGLVSLAAQFPKGAVRFVVLDSTPPGVPQREFLERVIRAIPHEVVQVKAGEVAEAMSTLAADLKKRAGDEQSGAAPETFVLIRGLQNYKKLKQEDEFGFSSGEGDAANPAAALQSLISEGPAHGIHVIATCDTYNNVNRFLGRKALTEFEMRVLFQMSASDSASLIDEPDASTLGLHRALYYNDREGYLETFRAYSLPDNEWVDRVARQLQR